MFRDCAFIMADIPIDRFALSGTLMYCTASSGAVQLHCPLWGCATALPHLGV